MFEKTKKSVILTAYDTSTADLLVQAGIDTILVGDSYGMVILGHENTKRVDLEMLIKVAKDVRKGAPKAFVIFDMPYKTYETPKEALKNARKALKETGCDAVKVEGEPEIVNFLVENNIKVMGHTGLKPQKMNKFIIQGRKNDEADLIFKEAKFLEEAGCFAVVLECIPDGLAMKITESLSIPTIGIGAGVHTDSQIRVIHDILGWSGGKDLSFVEELEGDNDLEKLRRFIHAYQK